ALGVGEETLIVFLGDNGTDAPIGHEHAVACAAPLRGKKGSHYEGGVRVPFIAAWGQPNAENPIQASLPIPAGAIQEQMGNVCDLMPTILSVARLSKPADHIVDGAPLNRLLSGVSDPGHSKQFLMHFPHVHRTNYFTIYRDGDWKIIHHDFPGEDSLGQEYELFQLSTDPFEQRNLANSEPDQLKRMISGMENSLQTHGAQLVASPADDDRRSVSDVPASDAPDEKDFVQKKGVTSESWISLFNGKDLDGWQPKIRGHELGVNYADTFRVRDGLLVVSYDKYTPADLRSMDGGRNASFDRFGHLFYKDTYSHYRLRVEYRFVGDQVPNGPGWAFRNNGLMLHGQDPATMERDQKFPTSIEVQLLGGDGTNKRSTLNLCTPGTNVVMPDGMLKPHCTTSQSKTYHGDQWVTAEIEVRGNEVIRHLIDGEVVLEYFQPQLDPRAPEAVPLIRDGNLMIDRGTISIQSESHPTEFRRIELLPLKAPGDRESNGMVKESDDFTGNWALVMPDGSAGWLTLGAAGSDLKGELWTVGAPKQLGGLRLQGRQISFTRKLRVGEPKFAGGPPTGDRVDCLHTATVQGDKIHLVVSLPSGDGKTENVPFSGQRMPPVPPRPDLKDIRFGEPIELFNGRDLQGWKLTNPDQINGWKAMDGELVNTTPKLSFDPFSQYGNLRTEREFTDFNLQLEFNVPAGGNSGVYLRGQYEAQVVDRDSRMQGIQGVGAIFNRITPSQNAGLAGGKWQSYDITLVDRHVTVVLNGKTVIDNEPILGCTNGALWADETIPGPLYLQGDHTAVRYRNIVLREVLDEGRDGE
ncbi:MAG: family 16 glycoside hydrolase, partial [Planctomycetota bacterium]